MLVIDNYGFKVNIYRTIHMKDPHKTNDNQLGNVDK